MELSYKRVEIGLNMASLQPGFGNFRQKHSLFMMLLVSGMRSFLIGSRCAQHSRFQRIWKLCLQLENFILALTLLVLLEILYQIGTAY